MTKLEDFLKFDMSLGGEAFRVWPKLVGMAFPDLAAKPLMVQLTILCHYAISNIEVATNQVLDMVEFAAGLGPFCGGSAEWHRWIESSHISTTA